MIIPNKHDGWVKNVRRVYDGGGSSAPSTTTQTTDLPDWAKPYAQETLEKAKQLSEQKYQVYDQPRIAGFDPAQQKAYQGVFNMGTSPQLGTATDISQLAAMRGLTAGYQPGYFENQFQAPRQYRPSQFDMMSAQAPDLRQYQMGPAERVRGGRYYAPMMDTAQTGYNPELQRYQMGPAERVTTQDYTGQNVEQYMSPFMQNVVDKQTREAERQAGLAAKQERAQSIQRGAFGGGRTAIREAAAARDLAQLKSDIYGTGQQAAFQNAQQQFNTQQQREMAAQQANQGAGLTVGGQNLAANLGVQQLGTQTGLQTAMANLSAQQQANVQNQAAKLQAQGLTAGQAMQAALANQQAGLTVGQQNLAAQLGTQQLGAGQNLQAQLANQQAYQNMLQQREASRQFGYGQDMAAAGQRAQYGQAAQQLGEQSRQFGAGYGMQGLGTALQGAGQLGNLGQQEFGQQKDIYGLLSQFGGQRQALTQQGLSQAYQDFLNQQNYPYKQLGYMSDMIRGLPMGQQSTAQMYQAPGSMMGQLGGIGMGLYGMSRMAGAEGGEVREYADGGSVDSSQNVANIVDSLSDQQLAQAKQAAQARGDYEQLQAITVEESMRASERRGMAGAFNQLSQGTQQKMMANGGIVAFAGGGVSPEFGGDAVEGISVNPFDLGRRARGGKSIEEYYGEPAFKASAASAPASDRSFDKAEEKRLSQPRTSAPTASTKAKPSAKPASMNASISSAVAQMSRESGVPEESLRSIYDGYKKSLRDESAADMKDLLAMVNKSTGGSKEIKEQALGKALAEFGFKWAASAAQPGAKFLGSAATAAPTIAASQAESAKLAREMDQNDMKLRMNLKQFEIAQRKGDLATAASLAAQERQLMQQGKQLELQRSQLAETARSNRAREGIAAQRATAGGGAMQKAYLAGMSKAQDRAARIAKDNWGNIAVQQDLKKQGFQSFDQYYDSLVKKEMKRAVPIYGVTAEAEADED